MAVTFVLGNAHNASVASIRSSVMSVRSARSPERRSEAISRRSLGERRLKSTSGLEPPAHRNQRTW